VELEEEEGKTLVLKNCQVSKTCKVEVKEESDDEDRPSENYKLAMKIIQEGLNHIKRDPSTPSKVIGAMQVLEGEANRNEGSTTNFEDKANKNRGEQEQEGLNHIKRDPTTPSKVIGAIRVLEEQANGKKGSTTNSEDKANGNRDEQIKLEQKESSDHQEGLNHIKRDPTTPSKVISAIKVLEDQANGKKGSKTNLEDNANKDGGEQIKLEQKELTDHQDEYFEYF